jgi:hypothetical protein
MANNSTSRSDNNWDNTNKLKTWVQATYSSITIGSDLVFPGAIHYLSTNAGSTSMNSGNGGYTWSSDHINNSNKAKYFSYNSTHWLNGMYGDSPSKAFPIRPVAEDESQTTTEGITISDWD